MSTPPRDAPSATAPRPAVPAGALRRCAVAVIGLALAGHVAVLALWPDAHTLLIDLQVYRAGGEHLLAGRPLYDGGVLLDLPFVYPPFAAAVFAPLSLLPVPVLAVLWTAGNLVLIAVVVRRGTTAGLLAVTALVCLVTWLDPVRTTLYLGQINVVLLALVATDVLGRRDSPWRGVGVGLAAAVKLTPLLFVVHLVLVGRIRAAATATGVFLGAGALGFLLAPADSSAFWVRGTFRAADRISPVAATTNHSLNGFLARTWGEAAGAAHLAVGGLIAVVALALAARAHRRGEELLGLTLCGLCTAAVAPFAWSHHWVWALPLVVLSADRWARGGDRVAAAALLAGLVATTAVITALPGPAVGPIPRTGLISLFPDAYLAGFLALLAAVGLRNGGGPRR